MKKVMSILISLALFLALSSFDMRDENVSERKLVALTFDDGPHAKHTKNILDTLERYNVKATFFVVGTNAERFPELVKEIAVRGHEIGNHTYSHPKMKSLSYDELKCELAKNDELLFSITGMRTSLFRPPHGEICDSVSSIAEDGGYKLVLWDVDTRDWEHTPKNTIVERVTKNVRPGAIILMHDFIGGEAHTPEALSEIIESLLEKGYEFVTVSELSDR